MDQSKKTMRHFYCRDVLWETFEQMANDFDCSIDYLINEAMRYYARSKNYQTSMAQPPPAQSAPHGSPPGYQQPAAGGGYGGGAPMAAPNPPPPPMGGGAPMPRGHRPSQPPPMGGGMAGGPPQPQAAMRQPPAPVGGGQPQQQQYAPPQQMSVSTLYLIYNNQRYPITKDQFIIGRGSKTSDLPIKDGNISRKHAAVIRRNGTYYIKDLGSTNGIDYKGMRIDNKRVDEGDVFHLCDYEIRFTYRPD